jgi:hypothetical protein
MTQPHQHDAARETEERFVRAIAEHVPVERVAEVYLFPPLRQGAIESGVAVVAVTDVLYDTVAPDDAPAVLAQGIDSSDADVASSAGDLSSDLPVRGERVVTSGDRHVVYTATYRHTRKGPERGTWSVEVVAQADAPLDAVAAAVRGVHRRAGDGDGAEADRLSGSQFRALLADGPPPASTATEPHAADAVGADRGGAGGAATDSSISSGGGGEGTR